MHMKLEQIVSSLLICVCFHASAAAACGASGAELCCGSVAYDPTRYFCRDGKVTGFHVDTCSPGRSVIVHLFNWKWTDIANECETYLGPNKFCGVQVSPPNEHRNIWDEGNRRPWWERYQPVSYKLQSRSGTEAQFVNMVQRCNAVHVRIFVDAVINHMAGYGSGTGYGSAGSYYNSQQMNFTGVPYGPTDFNCCHCGRCTTSNCRIHDYSNADQVRNCRLVGLLDLELGKEYVRGKVVSYLNQLINIGVAGFRVDAVKHMWPGDLQAIYDRINDLSTSAGFAPRTRPFIFNEVIDLGGESISSTEYTQFGRVTEFRYSRHLGQAFRRQFSLSSVLGHFATANWQWLPSDRALVFVDNHDNQRGHGAGGEDILTFYDGRRYRLATVFAMAHPYGFVRVMSSYNWTGGPHSNDWIGPPHNADSNWTISDVQMDSSTQQCLGDWVCEHRWPVVKTMVEWRSVAMESPLRHWWTDGQRQIAFSRADRAFIAINDDHSKTLDEQLQTGLPAGVYCDVISGGLADGCTRCRGRTVTVSGDGRARIIIEAATESSATDPVIAIHVGAVQGLQPSASGSLPAPPVTVTSGYQRTVILLQVHTQYRQQVFIRGGISHHRRSQCSVTPSACEISISHRLSTTPTTAHYANYRSWAAGDTKLDWLGAESGQGVVNGRAAGGSPAVWTTSQQSNTTAYHPLNRYGEHHWLLDVDMDCSATESGWFELKAFVTESSGAGTWERDVTQASCGGDIGGRRPYATSNHIAKCGFVNVFVFEHGACTIDHAGVGTPPPTTPPPTTFQRTVVSMKYQSVWSQQVFIRGGIDHQRRSECASTPSACSIPIHHCLSTTPTTRHYANYRSWAAGDTKLDWQGAESGQGVVNGRAAGGSPAVWTTNQQSNTVAYRSINKYGEHQWLLDVDMDCSATESGWFELKAYITDGNSSAGWWESNVAQNAVCSGNVGGRRPYATGNHVARCGYINVFEYQQSGCIIDSF